MILIKIIIAFLLADFCTGIFHFAVDTYGKFDGTIMTKSVNFLLMHHIEPDKILNQTYWELTGAVYKTSLVIFPLSLLIGFSWEFLLFLLFSANGNMIHKWAHQKKERRNPLVHTMQKIFLIQKPQQHMNHHNGAFNQNFCVMSNVLNPLFTLVHFWQSVVIFFKFIGINPNRPITHR